MNWPGMNWPGMNWPGMKPPSWRSLAASFAGLPSVRRAAGWLADAPATWSQLTGVAPATFTAKRGVRPAILAGR